MIEFLFGVKSHNIAQQFVEISHIYAAKYSEEKWNYYICEGSKKIAEFLMEHKLLDMACLDITIENGVSLAEETRRKNESSFIVIIADNSISPMQYIKPSIKAGSLLMKPLRLSEVKRVLEESIKSYIQEFYSQTGDKQFIIESRDGRQVIPYDKIYYFEARDKKIFINMGTKEIAFHDTIDHLEQVLPNVFLRCHRSFIIAKGKIDKIYLSQNMIILIDEYHIPLSRTYKQRIKELKN